ncbi:MAG: VCBS repeat-containing protein, partial [Bacteroidales bacterium]|nr:VCBS repeat-containing protein [Bacteroidales bacterium]
FIDNDNDNDLDIYATDPGNSGSIVLYKNTSNADTLRFELAADTENRFSAYSSIHSIAFADIDADNDIDALLLTESDTVRYFQHSADTFIEQLGTNNPFSGLTLENPTMDFRDLDGDNDIDAIAHDCRDLVFLENTTSNGRQQFVINTTDTIIRGINGQTLFFVFVDLDEDNDKDLFISNYVQVSVSQFYYYKYNATDSTFKADASEIEMPIHGFTEDIPKFIDFDNDGDLDLYMDNISDFYPPPNRLFINAGTSTNPKFQQTALAAFDIPLILGSVDEFVDIDGDGDLDMFHTYYFNPIQMYKNIGSATEPIFQLQDDANNPLSDISGSGDINNMDFSDIDGDGDFDLITAFQGHDPFINIRKNTGSPTNPEFSLVTLDPNPFSIIPLNIGAYTLKFFDFDGDNKEDLIFGNHHVSDSAVYKIFRNTSTTTNISFELMTEAPLAKFYSGEATFNMINLLGETGPSIIIDEIGGTGNSRDSIKYYNYIDFLSINQQTFSIDERSAAGTLVGRINYNYAGDSTLLF